MSYAARFQQVEVDPYRGLATAIHRKQHWMRRARQEHINRSGACVADRCDCPNCVEYRAIKMRAYNIHESNPYLTIHDAWDRACYEITNGAAETPWSDPA